jgi:transcriptional regulator with XRE-family HTH domain
MFGTSDLWRSLKRSAASPLGSRLRPVSRSLTDEGASPTCEPISARVIPFARRSEMRIDQGDIARDPTVPRNSCQRLPVTEFRHNGGMGRPVGLPKFDSIGARVKWWREHRGLSRKQLTKLVGMPYSTLSDLELGSSKNSEKLDLIALHLRVNTLYLRTDKGDPEAHITPAATDTAGTPERSLEANMVAQLRELDPDEVEEGYFAAQLEKVVETIKSTRNRKRHKTG